jgi:ETC complex I subunit conserved region
LTNPKALAHEAIMTARIFQRPKNAMQSGKAHTDEWVLEFTPAEPRKADPLMGWAGSGDTQAQVQLKFPSLAAAQAYAMKKGIAATFIPTPPKTLKLQAYADNFR